MQVDMSAVLEEYKKLLSATQYELVAHKLAVDVLERDNKDLSRQLEETNLELVRLRRTVETSEEE